MLELFFFSHYFHLTKQHDVIADFIHPSLFYYLCCLCFIHCGKCNAASAVVLGVGLYGALVTLVGC